MCFLLHSYICKLLVPDPPYLTHLPTRRIVTTYFTFVACRYQTGALAPLVRWLSQGMQRAAAPPQPPRAAGRPDNINGDAALAGMSILSESMTTTNPD